MAHVCLIYGQQDQEFAEQLAVQLQQRGLVIRPKPDPTTPGRGRRSEPGTMLVDATHVLAILSSTATTSETTVAKWHRALDARKQLFVILSQTCTIPERLQPFPIVDFRGRFLLAVEELVEHLEHTHAPTRPLSTEYIPPVTKPGLLPFKLPPERCWREDRVRINYDLPIILPTEQLTVRLPVFFAKAGFELVENTPTTFKARRLQQFRLFDPRRMRHTLTLELREGSLRITYQMTRSQVRFWTPSAYRVLDREAAALYGFLALGDLTDIMLPVDQQVRTVLILSWLTVVTLVLIALVLILGTVGKVIF